jgi:GT2 family glycosyltransferase
MYVWNEKKKGYNHIMEIPENKLVSVDATGMHCILIRREVFEKIERPYFFYDSTSEDMNFCKKAIKAGFEILVDTGITCGHLSAEPIGQATFERYKKNQPIT